MLTVARIPAVSVHSKPAHHPKAPPQHRLQTPTNSRFFASPVILLRMPAAIGTATRRTPRTMEDVWERRPLNVASKAVSAAFGSTASNDDVSLLPVLTAVAVAGCGAFCFGYHLACLNGVLEQIAIDLGFAANATLQGFVVSSALAGAAAGSLGGAGLADRLGRRRAFFMAALPLLAGAFVCASAAGIGALLVGRVLVGLGIGLSSALVPLYISEIAPTALRGTLGSLNQLLICVGILMALVVNVSIPATAWRTVFALALVPAGLLGLGMFFCPESPTWLAMSGRRSEAESTARRLWGSGGLTQLGSAESASGQPQPRWGEVLAAPGARVGAVLFLLQQFSGINAVIYFSTRIFGEAGVASGAAASALVGAVNVAGTVMAAGLMEKAGRK
jgi:sugar porter (SP) family MFS transporter